MTNRTIVVCAFMLVATLAIPGLAAATTGGSVAETGLQTANTTERADLVVRQQAWVDDEVRVDTGGDVPVYIGQGRVFDLAPQQFSNDEVIDYGVEEDAGELTYDREFGHYRFRGTENGSYTLYWVVVERTTVEVPAGNNTTETVNETRTQQVRHEAVLRTDGQEVAHVPQSRIDRLEEDAANWSEWRGTLQDVFGADVNIQQKTQLAIEVLRVRANPFAALLGGGGILLLLLTTQRGLIIVGLDRLRELLVHRRLHQDRNQQAALDADRADIDADLDAHEHAERTRDMVNTDIVDVVDDDRQAYAIERSLDAETEHDMWVAMNQRWQPQYLNAFVLETMALEGRDWRAAMFVDGDGDGEDATVTTHVVPPGEARPSDACLVEPLHEDVTLDDGTETTVDHVPAILSSFDASTEAFLGYEPAAADIDAERRSELLNSIDFDVPSDVHDLGRAIGEQRTAFDSDEDVATVFLHVVEDIRQRSHTDADGFADPLSEFLHTMLTVTKQNRDIRQTPAAHLWTVVLEDFIHRHDPLEETRNAVDRSREGRYGD